MHRIIHKYFNETDPIFFNFFAALTFLTQPDSSHGDALQVEGAQSDADEACLLRGVTARGEPLRGRGMRR